MAMGLLDGMIAKSTTANVAPIEVPAFEPSDKSGMTDRELNEQILDKLERFEHMAKSFSAQAAAHPLLKGLAPKL
jgi:hypothetical protein